MSAEIKNITQIGIVTGDLYAMVDRYQKLYGIGPWEIRDGKKGFKDEAEDLMVYGSARTSRCLWRCAWRETCSWS